MDKLEQTEVNLILTWPLSSGSYYSYNRRTRYVTKKGKEYQSIIAEEVYEQCAQGISLNPPLEFNVIFYPPTKGVWDFDNHLKALQDSLTLAGVWKDDSNLYQMHCYKGMVLARGKVIVRISEGGPALPFLGLDSSVWELLS